MTDHSCICPIHKVEMICPACNGEKGGKIRTKKYGKKTIAKWGAMGKGKKHAFAPRPNRRKKQEPPA